LSFLLYERANKLTLAAKRISYYFIYLFIITSYTEYMTHYTNTQLHKKSTE